uniref:Butyrophilin subfamily 1 member A1 n=1 Tax=Pelodiscus sinensis TaxID=13735 RepID=K7GBJ7_PELSI
LEILTGLKNCIVYCKLCMLVQDTFWPFTARFTVVGPGHPVTAVVGEEIVLPCRLFPRMSAENMEVRWFRSEFTSFVHLYRRGKDEFGQQMPEYHGRTELLKASLTDGNVALKIVNVRRSDEGQYRCSVQDGVFHVEAELELKITGKFPAPGLSAKGASDSCSARLRITSGGASPCFAVFGDSFKNYCPQMPHSPIKDESGILFLFFFLMLRTCIVKNASIEYNSSLLLQMKECHLLFPDVSSPGAVPWIVVWIVTLVILLVFIGLTLFLLKSKHSHRRSKCPGSTEAEFFPRFQSGKLLRELEWRRCLIDADNVTLDEDTAHVLLKLSEDGKCLQWGYDVQSRPDIPERFDVDPCVLGNERFTSGRHSWEVDVGNGHNWAVGVAKESVSRKGGISMTPEGGIWAVQRSGSNCWALTDYVTPLLLSQIPRRVRVCLDCDRGQVVFTNADTENLIYVFPP